jgi:hypothetical protein
MTQPLSRLVLGAGLRAHREQLEANQNMLLGGLAYYQSRGGTEIRREPVT